MGKLIFSKRYSLSVKRLYGFTLIELIVVIAIIAVLAAIIAPNAFKAIQKAKIAKATQDVKAIASAMQSLYVDTGLWSGQAAGAYAEFNNAIGPQLNLPQLGLLQNDGRYPYWDGPYLEKPLTNDPWRYGYMYDGTPVSEPGLGQSSISSGGPNGDGNWCPSVNRIDKIPQGDDIIIYLS
ncbi:MAG: prepilin-type N-terminal cleavage/methylation domain-containing protein [Candidatus Omnitrophica bacterium]|nr:prepilin-type N-terminal cleavage/methylation domain-containing protein [Candidatus Omnitrophota bacterium]